MILTPISTDDLPALLDAFAAKLGDFPLAAKAFRLIADSVIHVEGSLSALSQKPEHMTQAIALCRRFGMEPCPGLAYTWDGRRFRADMEPSVIIHEVAHLQVAAPKRRSLVDFGLGAGPETDDKAPADQAQLVNGVSREWEEALASLLGILWEAVLDQPAILAFIEQNWLEGGADDRNRDHFVRAIAALAKDGLIDEDAHPCMALRDTEHDLLPEMQIRKDDGHNSNG